MLRRLSRPAGIRYAGFPAGHYDMDFVFDFASVRGIEAASATTASIFPALQVHLGFKLEPSREPMDVLVIDSVERPTPD